MRRNLLLGFAVLSLFASSALLGGCGSSKKEGQKDVVTTVQLQNAARLGDENCLQCHNSGQDLTMAGSGDGRTIGEAWRTGLHHQSVNGIVTVHCEDCHGGGQFHWGLGPLAFPNPQADVCLKCHGNNRPAGVGADFGNYTAYLNTAHANRDNLPDKFFFQGGTGNEQAENRGVPEFVKWTRTPVTKNQHIEECSVCHNSNQRFVFGTLSSNSGSSFGAAGSLLKPDPENMPTPQVACASCHDAHGIGREVRVATRTEPVDYPILRKVQVDKRGANNPLFGNWTSPHIFSTNGVVQAGGEVTPAALQGANNELNTELLCASCHTKGIYKYGKQETHNEDVYPQWRNSGHGDRFAAAWAEFSANPRYYGYEDLSHQTSYPFDMSLKVTGATANTTRNAGNNNFACFKCHNGIASIDWQNNVQGTPQARVVWGDEPAVCITCHDPHRNYPGQDANTRRPVVMTNYSTAFFRIVGNVFLDTKPLPSHDKTENATICIFCHQGRESGYTLYKSKLAPGRTANGPFLNPHYLGTAAMLWGANAYEFPGKKYGANTAHQNANCTTCHMANPTETDKNGGHTWDPNVVTCNTAECHGGALGVVHSVTGTSDPNVNTYRAATDRNDYDGDGTLEPIAVEITHLQDRLIALLAANGIYYDDLAYPYFFSDPVVHTNATRFTAWGTTPGGTEAYKAAFNLQYIIKGLPSAETSQTLIPNASAAVHNYIYIIQILQDSYNNYLAASPNDGPGPLPAAAVRPAGTRLATVYGPGQ